MAAKAILAPNHQFIVDSVRAGQSDGWIAQRLNVHRSAIHAYRKKHDLDQPAPGAVALAEEVSREELLEAENAELRKAQGKVRKQAIEDQRLLLAIQGVVPTAPVKFTAKAPTTVERHVHNLLLSDLHYGETVDPEQVNGLNEFNVAVLERRLEHVLHAIRGFQRTRKYAVTEMVVSLLGDMCSGDPGIHDEIKESNEVGGAEQAIGCGLLIGSFIEQLVPDYEQIRVLGVSGNHPRMAKPHASKNVHNNLDWIAYQAAEIYLRNYESVSCRFPKSGLLVEQIAGRNVLLFHGDGIRSSMPGVPWGGVMRRVSELKKQHAEQGLILHGFQLGHFHQANVVAGEVFMNGSLVGTNEYGLKNFGGGMAPTQLLLTWDRVRERLTDVSFVTPS